MSTHWEFPRQRKSASDTKQSLAKSNFNLKWVRNKEAWTTFMLNYSVKWLQTRDVNLKNKRSLRRPNKRDVQNNKDNWISRRMGRKRNAWRRYKRNRKSWPLKVFSSLKKRLKSLRNLTRQKYRPLADYNRHSLVKVWHRLSSKKWWRRAKKLPYRGKNIWK